MRRFSPANNDSEDPGLGIVKTINIFSRSDLIRGRYIVYRDNTTNRYKSQDISELYGKPAGTIWVIYSEGQIIRRDTNQVIAKKTIGCLIRRVAIQIPYDATIICRNISNIRLVSRINLRSSDINIVGVSGNPGIEDRNTCSIIPANSINTVTDYDEKVTLNWIFGMTFDELRKVADYVVSDQHRSFLRIRDNSFKC
ncbi:MAG: hypothetical protein RMJ51_03080 [Candidatus Calescibacterium sp.]|nr:hypothetical protein [Candidatus Calescibacterium sp.]MDW8195209.1 hypothetical protein [Candidatus Calescibacterium sp.]